MNDLVFQSGQTVLFIGDSITDCGRRQDQEQLGNGYVRKVTELITAKYPHRDISYVNKGIGGDTVEGLESRWTTDVLDIKPDWLSIKIGINNAARQEDLDDIYIPKWESAYRGILNRSKNELDLAGIFLFEIFYSAEDVEFPQQWSVPEYNKVIHQLAEEFGAQLVPVNIVFQQAVVDRPGFPWTTMDGVHPNPTGHSLMALEFLKIVNW